MPHTDVSVIVPVYNTMPYLTQTLESLVGQTIGLDRLQVVTVDDGSTDGSGEELDRFADQYPETFVVVHQPNSGGPATPCNRGLELATGRYVFFLGADDYLGEEALERLVDRADEWGSDVIFGRMEGVGGRNVYQGIFEETVEDLDVLESDLAFALSNTKLYRRDLLTRNDIHYARDLRVGSDQPFTVDAVIHASKVSVLGDYTYYYAVRREDSTNISFSSTWKQRVDDIGAVMDHVADLLPPAGNATPSSRRHFTWELAKVLRNDLPEVDEAEQEALAAAVAELSERYLTDRIADGLSLESRVRHRLAQAGDVAALRELAEARDPDPDAKGLFATRMLTLDGDRIYSPLPGFRDGGGHPDAWYDVTDRKTRKRVVQGFSTGKVRLDGHVLKVKGKVPFTADSADGLRLTLVRMEPGVTVPGTGRTERVRRACLCRRRGRVPRHPHRRRPQQAGSAAGRDRPPRAARGRRSEDPLGRPAPRRRRPVDLRPAAEDVRTEADRRGQQGPPACRVQRLPRQAPPPGAPPRTAPLRGRPSPGAARPEQMNEER